MALDTLIRGIVGRALPTAKADNGADGDKVRLARYGEQFALPVGSPRHSLADEGSYYIGTNPSLGTGLAYGLRDSFTDTAAFLVFHNPESAGNPNAKRMYLDYLRAVVTVVPASATSGKMALKLDGGVSRAPSANSVGITPVSPNGDIGGAAVGKLWAASGGTLTVAASSGSARTIVPRATVHPLLPIVEDEMILQFGGYDPAGGIPPAAARAANQAVRCVTHAPPVILGAGQFLLVYLWFPANATTPLSYEFDCGWWER